jgi:hypothetical protein
MTGSIPRGREVVQARWDEVSRRHQVPMIEDSKIVDERPN